MKLMLEKTIAKIGAPNKRTALAAHRRLDNLTKPQGSLGRLEELACKLAGMTGNPRPRFRKKVVITMAADHGIAREGVSAYPQEVTLQMVMNFLHGGAGINALARQAAASVVVVDMGVNAALGRQKGLVSVRIGPGTWNFLHEPAMSRDQARRSVEEGIRIAEAQIRRGADIIGTGDMGIGNTASAAAITAVFTRRPVAAVTGRGTGIDNARLRRKICILERALRLHRPDPKDPVGVLSKVGGFEIGGLAGVMLACASRRVPVVVDGFISSAAALVAASLCPRSKNFMIPSHCSVEPGHKAQLEWLGLAPYLDMSMRLGEGTGAALAFHIIEAATRILDEMATFEEAQVAGKLN